MPNFSIDGTELEAPLDPRVAGRIPIASVPRAYDVRWVDGPIGTAVESIMATASHPLALVDEHVRDTVLRQCTFAAPIMTIRANEETKSVASALEACSFLQTNGANRGSMLFVIGGGVLQDIGAFAAAAYKRGIPWTYLPTTLLGQGDSCIGGKTGLNHDGIKNLIALFSAPGRVVIHSGFLDTLTNEDIRSGLGEIFRLHVTGGEPFLERYEALLPACLDGDHAAAESLVAGSLSVKRAVVEADEFELNLRKGMNYGHSIGHAFEAASNHAVPHGLAVVIGMLVENEIAIDLAGLSDSDATRLARCARALLPPDVMDTMMDLDLSRMTDILSKDKKSVGTTLKMACQSAIGTMRFVDFPLDRDTPARVRDAVSRARERFVGP